MKLSEEQKDIVSKKIQKHLTGSCQVCNERRWIMNDTIFELRPYNQGTLTVGGGIPIQPLVSVICDNCGNTLFFNAIKIGAIKAEA